LLYDLVIMISKETFKKQLQNLRPDLFEEQALALFRYQAQNNQIYRQYLEFLRVNPHSIGEVHRIPFLPIEFFKSHKIKTGTFTAQVVYQSSGTTQQARSKHYLPDDTFYKAHARQIFESSYGLVTDYIFLALLPSYLEQGHSSLVAMVDSFVSQSGQVMAGFYLQELDALLSNIDLARQSGKKILLFGVTYALLDLAEKVRPGSLKDVLILETGGMKGRRREMVRQELHATLQEAFGVSSIHSEYGMTELLSQAYSKGEGIFQTPHSLKILLRDPNDPLTVGAGITTGGINIIDLANVDSCAFLETKDIGRLHGDGRFEVLGRFDNTDIRGCNLLVA
jgi:phenylacetate-coenzyme A ligase PaaK-like adenylate-forming protein